MPEATSNQHAEVQRYSPGEYHRSLPRELKRNVLARARILAQIDPGVRQGFLEMSRQDILFWINAFVWQFNPNTIGTGSSEHGPFITWPFQEACLRDEPTEDEPDRVGILWCVRERRDLVIEKSREMGASWLCLLAILWLALFHRGKKFLVISRSEEAVDKPGEPDSLFWKIDYVLSTLPDWMTRGIRRRKRSFWFPNGSSITGQASTGKAGVGGRATAMFIDEFSQIDEDREVRQRTSDTTGCRIFNGTHLGVDTEFYQLTKQVDMKKRLLHWTEHPDKRKGLYRVDGGKLTVLDREHVFPEDFNFILDGHPTGGPFPGIRSPWYDAQCLRKNSQRGVAMDLDIDPSGSTYQFFDPLIIRQLQDTYCQEPAWVGDFQQDADTKTWRLLRHAKGKLRMWVVPGGDGWVPQANYAAGADIATGTGSSPSCLSIGNIQTGEKVAEYTNADINPETFALIAVALCRLFQNRDGQGALFAWEMAGPGLKFGLTVLELGYTRIYYRKDEVAVNAEESDRPGWFPAPYAKKILLENYRSALYSREFINRSKEALEETLSFQYGKREQVFHAEEASSDPLKGSVNHGDHVIADALVWLMAKGKQRTMVKHEVQRLSVLSLGGRRQLYEEQNEQVMVW